MGKGIKGMGCEGKGIYKEGEETPQPQVIPLSHHHFPPPSTITNPPHHHYCKKPNHQTQPSTPFTTSHPSRETSQLRQQQLINSPDRSAPEKALQYGWNIRRNVRLLGGNDKAEPANTNTVVIKVEMNTSKSYCSVLSRLITLFSACTFRPPPPGHCQDTHASRS